MEFLSFSRMRSYRKNNRTSVVLKLVLPRSHDGEEERFNSFYLSLAECYLDFAEKLSDSIPLGTQPTVISVNFEISEELPDGRLYEKNKENIVVIRRTHRIRCAEHVTVGEFLDFYDTKRGIFIK